MTALSDAIDHDLRLAILQLLSDQVGYQANSRVLHSGVQALRFRVSLDKVITEIDWLAEQRLVESEDIGSGVILAIATQRGRDAAAGLIAVRGVAQPDPLAKKG